MEGSEGEAVFEKFNLKPRLFINEALGRVDDLLDGALDYFHQEASRLLNTDRSQDIDSGVKYVHCTIQDSLDKRFSMWENYALYHCFGVPSGFTLPPEGVKYVHCTIQDSLDKRFSMWENYALYHCFGVPSGFTLPPENEASGDDAMDQDDFSDEQIDAQLDSLRSKLAVAGNECSQLNQELKELETKSALTNQCASAVNEALQLYDSSSAQEVFQEMLRVASELRQKMDQLKAKQKEDMEHNQLEVADIANGGLSNLKSDTLQEFIAEMNL